MAVINRAKVSGKIYDIYGERVFHPNTAAGLRDGNVTIYGKDAGLKYSRRRY
jgi:hypothetical protein